MYVMYEEWQKGGVLLYVRNEIVACELTEIRNGKYRKWRIRNVHDVSGMTDDIPLTRYTPWKERDDVPTCEMERRYSRFSRIPETYKDPMLCMIYTWRWQTIYPWVIKYILNYRNSEVRYCFNLDFVFWYSLPYSHLQKSFHIFSAIQILHGLGAS